MIDDILSISNHADSIDPRKPDKVGDKKGSKGQEAKATENGDAGDSISISSTAKEKLDQARLEDTVKNMPDVREEKVIEARAKVESGELLTQEVTEKVADELDNLL